MQSEREKVAAHQDLDRLRAELCDLRQELAVLQEDREHAMAQWYIFGFLSCYSNIYSNDLALSNTKALIELASYRSSINCVLDQVKSLVGPFTELSEIPTQISKMIQKQSELQSALAALEKELSHAKQTISDLQTANNSLQLLLEEAGNRMVSTITEEQRRYDVLRLEHQELTQSHMRIQSLNDGLILEREGAKMEAQKAFDERDSVLKRVQQLEAVIGSFEHLKNEALLAQRLEHQTSEQMLNSQVLYWQKLYQGAVSSLEAAEVGLQEKLAELKCLTNRLDIEVAQRSQIIKRNEALVSKITSMKDQLRELRSSLKTRQLENQELVSRNAADTKMLGQLKAAIGELETEKASLRDEISRSEAQAYTLESALHSTREEHTLERLKLETELQKFHNELTRLRELATSYKEEIGLLQAGIKEERERSFLNQQQQAEYDRLVAQNSTLEHEVKGLLEELTSERQQFKELRETLKVTLSDLKTTQERLIDREDHGSRLERELKNEQYVRSCLEQSSCQAKILKYEQCQKWIDRLKGLLSEANQIREGISGMAAVGSNFVPAINHEGIAALQAVLKRRQGCDLEVETDPEYTSEVKLIESRIGQERKAMNEEHESVLTYIHQLGCQLYQRSFFTLG